MSIKLVFADRFKRDIRRLSKRYRSIRIDLQPLIDKLEAGELPGDQVSDVDYIVFKVRVKNSNIQKGKSSGYRVIYYLQASDQIILITMYSKSDQSNIDASEVREIISDAEAQLSESENSKNEEEEDTAE